MRCQGNETRPAREPPVGSASGTFSRAGAHFYNAFDDKEHFLSHGTVPAKARPATPSNYRRGRGGDGGARRVALADRVWRGTHWEASTAFLITALHSTALLFTLAAWLRSHTNYTAGFSFKTGPFISIVSNPSRIYATYATLQ